MFTAADIAITFVVFKPCFIVFVFGLSWVSVKWFSGSGVTALLKCVPCRKNHNTVWPAPYVAERPPQKIAPSKSTDSVQKAIAVDAQVKTVVASSKERTHSNVQRRHSNVQRRHDAVIQAMDHGWSGGEHDESEVHSRGVDLLQIIQ